jgi:hypothetical protein
MRVSDAYSGSYCSVEQWPTTPTEHTITGFGIEDDSFKENGNAHIIFVQLDDTEPKYRVNKTNAQALAAVFGDELKNWKGCTISINRSQGIVKGKKAWVGTMEPVSAAPKKSKKT